MIKVSHLLIEKALQHLYLQKMYATIWTEKNMVTIYKFGLHIWACKDKPSDASLLLWKNFEEHFLIANYVQIIRFLFNSNLIVQKSEFVFEYFTYLLTVSWN